MIRRPIQRFEDLSYYSQLAGRITELAGAGWDPSRIAGQLNTEGFLPARGAGPIRHRLVTQILHRAGAPIPHKRQPLPPTPTTHRGTRMVAAAARGRTRRDHRHRSQMAAPGTHRRTAETRHPHRWIVHADPGELAGLRAHIDRVRGRTTRVHPKFADDTPDHVTPAQSA